MIGARMQFAAILWHIATLSDQPIALGALGMVRVVPIIIFSLIGGAVADIRNRRQVLFITQGVRMGTAIFLALLTFSGEIGLWHIYLLTGIEAIATSFDQPARQAMLPNLLPARDLPNAFSIQSIAFQLGSVAGPALGGIVIASMGLGAAYGFNAFSYLAMFAALLMMGAVKQEEDPVKRATISLKSIQEGWQFITGHPIILSIMILDFFATFFSSASALMPLFARDILKVGEIGYGWLSAAPSIGAALTAVIMSQVNNLRKQGLLLLWAVVVYGAATIGFGASNTFILAMFMLMLLGASDTVSTIIRNTIRQLQTPDYIRGRMVSINQIFFMGGPQLGELEAGIVAQFFGVPFAIVSGGAACLLGVGWIARRWPALRQYDREPDQEFERTATG